MLKVVTFSKIDLLKPWNTFGKDKSLSNQLKLRKLIANGIYMFSDNPN